MKFLVHGKGFKVGREKIRIGGICVVVLFLYKKLFFVQKDLFGLLCTD